MNIKEKDCIISADTILCKEELNVVKEHSLLIRDGYIREIIPNTILHKYISKSNNADDFCLIKDTNIRVRYINLGNKTLLPGLIDTHSHLSLDARRKDHLFMMNDRECIQTVRAIQNIKDDIMAGITTLRSLGDKYHIDVFIRNMVEKNELDGPHILASGIGMKGIHGHGYVGQSYTGENEFRKISRENLQQGTDWLKLFITPGIPQKNGDLIPCFLSEKEIAVVTEEAHAVGKLVTAHCIGGEGLRRCITNHVDMIEHAYCVTDNEIEFMVKHNVRLCLTSGIFLDSSREVFCHQSLVDALQYHRENVAKTTKRIIESGIDFSLGSDAYHGLVYKEAIIVSQLGSSNKKSLQGITSQAAKHLNLQHKCGQIEKNLCADLIACKDNPLENLETLSHPCFIMKHGKLYKYNE